jgi:hypothetical protein
MVHPTSLNSSGLKPEIKSQKYKLHESNALFNVNVILKKLVEYKLMMTIIKTRIVVLSTTAY